MSENLQQHTSLLVVSDSGMYRYQGAVFAFEPVLKELNAMLAIFKTITWIGFNRVDKRNHPAYTRIESKYIRVILLNSVGGTSFIDKLAIVGNYPTMYKLIDTEIKKHAVIHSRAPSNPAYIAMRLSKKYPEKRFWFKYAGNWTESAPFFYNLQRKKLKKLPRNSIITVNGEWKAQPKNVVPFENPCLTQADRKEGSKVVTTKNLEKTKKYCFVGGLNENKGVKLLLEVFCKLSGYEETIELHIVGDGLLINWVEEAKERSKNRIIIHGALPKEEVYEVYKKCQFLVLPSKSEGFPKVISEAMNFGCIPIVSDISCISQYIKDDENGFLISPLSVAGLKISIDKSLAVSKQKFHDIIDYNYNLAERFTYSYYINKIASEILDNQTK